MADANSVTAALATLGSAGFTCAVPSAYTGGPLASPGPIGSTVASSGAFTTLSATAGAINNCSVGVTTPAVVKTSDLQTNTADSSATPGNQTSNTPSGRCSIAAAGATVTVINSLVTAASRVFASVGTNDATALIKNVVPGAGSFVVTMNAAVTGTTSINWLVIN